LPRDGSPEGLGRREGNVGEIGRRVTTRKEVIRLPEGLGSREGKVKK